MLLLSYFATMALIDPQDADSDKSMEDCARQLDQFVRTRTAYSFHVKGGIVQIVPPGVPAA